MRRMARRVICCDKGSNHEYEHARHAGHRIQPFEFVEWASPLQFVVTDGRGLFEIRWASRGRFELVSVKGVR